MTTLDREYPIIEFDPERRAIIDPEYAAGDVRLPERGVICFFGDLLETLVKRGDLVEACVQHSGLKPMPIYSLETCCERIAVFHPGIGASFAASMLEEAIAKGCRKLIACGGAGVLTSEIELGKNRGAHLSRPRRGHLLPLPASRARGGTESRGARRHRIGAESGRRRLPQGQDLDHRRHLPRDARARIEHRRKEGCLTVEMEAAAFFAVAAFRGVKLAQILYGGDDVSGQEWDDRGWQKRTSVRERLFWLAMESCLAI